MADGANKKRGALRQLTKDDDPDAEEDSSPSETGTFKRASAEVMATRKIVKVRRSSAAPTASNPFANIQLVAPAAPLPTPITDGVPKASSPQAADLVQETAAKAEEAEKLNGNGKAEVAATENGSKDEQPAAIETPPAEGKALDGLTSFEQVSSSANAFGSFGTAFSGSAFSFSSSLGSSSAFSFGSSASLGSATSFSFGSSSSTVGFASFNASSTGFDSKSAEPFPTIFGSTSSSSSSPSAAQQSHPTVSLQEVPVETGEEKETAVFSGDAILYEFVDKSWKERGKGELKLNVSEDNKARLVMRSKGNLKLLLNAGLFPDMRVSKMDTKSVTFACANSAAAGKETVLTTYAVKLRDASGIPDFLALIDTHKGVKSVPSSATGTSSQKPDDEHKEKAETTNEEVQKDTDLVAKNDQVPVATTTGGEDDQAKEQPVSTETGKEAMV